MDERLVFLIFPAVGLVLLAIGVIVWLRTRRFIAASFRVSGTVVGLAARRGHKGGTTYSPVVEFATREGAIRQFTDPVSSRPAGYSVGQRVEVLYHYRDHDRARLASRFRLYFVPALLGLIGLVFAFVGAVMALGNFGRGGEYW
ncbi:MAG TPA: DUF3592 domain-containing protein [Pyrinomonadaceae bacterium]|nr:DUF3592 domain-containing protein [Pyrinomonadaceae bacterium]